MSGDADIQQPTLTPVGEPVVAVTPDALVKIIDVRDNEDDPESLVLRIAVTGVNGIEYAYDLSFEPRAELVGEHLVYAVGDLEVVVPVDSADALTGATLDIPSNPTQGGLVIRNPNRPNPLEGRKLELTGDLPEKVQQLLDQSINPSLAAHGGYAELVGVEGNTVFVSMGGGCQGCSMSAATLSMGIQRSIKEAIPEVDEVVDVTDHALGANPYYT